MDKILEIHGAKYFKPSIVVLMFMCDKEDDGDLVCQAGARWEDINEELKTKGIPLFFPVSSL